MRSIITNNGTASDEAIEDLRSLADETPMFFKLALQHRQYRVELGADMKNRHPLLKLNDDDYGFFAPTIRNIFLAERERPRLGGSYNHELGHFADLEILGTGDWRNGYFSLTAAFQEALCQDVAALKATNFTLLDMLGLKVLKEYPDEDHKFWCTQWHNHFMKTMRDPKEIAAELFCNSQGYASNMPYEVTGIFPTCNQLLLDRLSPYLR